MSLYGKSLDGVTASQIGTAFFADEPKTSASMQLSYSGSPTNFHCDLEYTLDSTNWILATSWNFGGPASGGFVQDSGLPPFIGIRANLTLTGTATITAWVAAA